MPKFDVKLKNIDLPQLPPVAAKPIYVGVGATDLAVQKVKAYATDVQAKLTAKAADVQKDATARVAGVQRTVKGLELPEPKALQDKAIATLVEGKDRFEATLVELQAVPTKVQTKVDENVATATATYAELAKRGESVVTRIRKGESAAPVQVTKKVPARKAPAKKTTATRSPARKTTATKAPAKKTAAK